MQKIKTISDREFESYFKTLYGFVFTAFILLVAGIYISVNSLKNGSASFELTVSNMTFIYLIAIPVISMRIFAEERKQKTEQLYYSLPVKMHQVVLGKYFAACTVIALPIAIMALYPLVLNFFGKVDLKAAYCALLGFWMLGCSICAICMFLSALTDNQAVAAASGFIAVLLLFFVSTLASMLPGKLAVIADIFRNISPFDRYYSFLNGIFDIRSAVYLICVAAFFVVLTVMIMERRRSENKHLFYSLAASLTVAIIVLLDLVIGNLPEKTTQLQMNSVGIRDFSSETVKQAETLDKDVSIYWICRDGFEDTFIAETLDEFDGLSNMIHVVKIDPITQPQFANRYTNKTVNENSLVVECGTEAKYIDYSDIYVYSESENVKRADFFCESQISNSIARVTDNRSFTVYVLSGHGEKMLADTFISGLENHNYTVKTLDLLSSGYVPEDCSCLMVQGTPADLTDSEKAGIEDYLNDGGRLLLFSTYLDENTPNWTELLKQYGLNPQAGIVIEGNNNYYVSNYPYYILPEIHEHEITESMIADGKRVIVPLSQSLMPDTTLPEETEIDVILSTSNAAFAKADGFDMKTTEREDGDLTGKFILGASATNGKSAVVWFPSAYVLEDAVNTSVSGGNLQLLLNSIDWLTESGSGLTAQPRHLGGGTLVVNAKTSEVLSITIIAILPLIFIGYGVILIRRRKSK